MADKRTFIGIPLPEAIREQLLVVQKVLEPVSGGVKWVDPELMHITLKFLGETPERMLDAIRSEFLHAVSGISPFQLQIRQLGQFPKEGEPRVLWAGVQRIPGRIYTLSDELNTAYVAMGFDDSGKRFSPHITLGRIKHKLHIDFVRQYYELILQETVFDVDRIIWYESCTSHGKLNYVPLEEHKLDQI